MAWTDLLLIATSEIYVKSIISYDAMDFPQLSLVPPIKAIFFTVRTNP